MKTFLRNQGWEFLLGIVMVLSISKPALAIDWDGEGPTSEWLDALNWEFIAIPTTADTATIINDIAAITGVFVPPIQILQLGSGSSSGGLTMTGGSGAATLEVIDTVSVGEAGELNVGLLARICG